MTKQAILLPPAVNRINWKDSLAKLAIGDKLLIHGQPQYTVGANLTTHNRNGKRYVSKKAKDGVYVIRVE